MKSHDPYRWDTWAFVIQVVVILLLWAAFAVLMFDLAPKGVQAVKALLS